MTTKNLLFSGVRQKDEWARLNPQFIGKGVELTKTHYMRRQKQLQQLQLKNRVEFIQKERKSAQKMAQKKQQQLAKLVGTISRREQEQKQKEDDKRARAALEEELRELNRKRRSQHQNKMRSVYLDHYDRNYQQSQLTRSIQKKHEQMRKTIKLQQLQTNREKAFQLNLSHSEGKKRVNQYFKTRNDSFTDRYRNRISYQKRIAEQISNNISILGQRQRLIKEQLQKSTGKLQQLEQKYKQTYSGRLWNSRVTSKKQSKNRQNEDSDAMINQLIQGEMSSSELFKI